jgi:serine/threonine protein kinase
MIRSPYGLFATSPFLPTPLPDLLQLDNLLLDVERKVVKLCDFGFSERFKPGTTQLHARIVPHIVSGDCGAGPDSCPLLSLTEVTRRIVKDVSRDHGVLAAGGPQRHAILARAARCTNCFPFCFIFFYFFFFFFIDSFPLCFWFSGPLLLLVLRCLFLSVGIRLSSSIFYFLCFFFLFPLYIFLVFVRCERTGAGVEHGRAAVQDAQRTLSLRVPH